MAGDFEEKYLQLRDENLALKKKKNEQEATIKRMYTKLAMIEEAMKKKKVSGDGTDNQDDPDAASGGGVVPSRRDLDTEKFVQALKSENAQLRKKNQALMEKNRQLEEKMRQHQLKYHSNPKALSVSAANAGLAPRKTTPKVHAVATKRSVGYAADGDSIERQVDEARRVHRDHLAGDLEMALKNRLVIAEKQLVKLQRENEQLRATSTEHGKLAGSRRRRTSGGNNNALSDGEESGDERTLSNMDVEHLRRELRDRQAQVAILHARYENLEANAAAEREIQEQTIEQLEHMNRQVHKLRSQLQDTSLEKEDLEVRLSKTADLEREMAMLRDQNRKLEERMTSLCESPFINDAFQRKERIDRMFDLEKQTQEQKTTITHMAEENQKLQVIVKELHSNVKLMKQAKEMVEQDMDKLRQQLVEERNARNLAAITTLPMASTHATPKPASPKRPDPISSYTTTQPVKRDAASSPLKGEQPAPFSTTGSAMSIVTRRYPDPTLSGSLTNTGDLDGPDANSVKHLRNRIHVLQLAHLKAIQELERCEKMLHAQTNINRELAQEIEELTTKNVSSAGNLQKRIKQLEISVEEKQQRIQLLEAQNRQLKYAREKLAKAQESERRFSELCHASDEEDESNEVASVTESLVLAARDLSPGEQLLEIWIIGATFDRSVISANASTFVLCDFYDFESQSTPLLVGHRPEFNFSSIFKVTVDAFFLRYLASETLIFELHQAVQGDFRLMGRATVPLHSLLRSKGVIKDPELPVKLAFGVEHDTIIGTLNVALRFAAPISEIWKLHLRSYPQDIQLLSKNRLGSCTVDPTEEYASEDGFDDNQLKAVNELQITVFACRGLRSYVKRRAGPGDAEAALTTKPSSYVHYQILGFPDMFTNIVPSSSSPEFDLHVSKQFFTVEVDACLLQFFAKFQLWFTVFDDHVDTHSASATDGAIGRCGILLEEITKGETLRGWYQLRDRNDQPAGEISILIEWRDPFQVAQLYSLTRRAGSSRKTADLHSLDYDQQHAIMRLFAPDMDGRVNYRQFLTYALPSESLELVTSKIKERLEYAIDTEQIQSAGDVFVPNVNHPSSTLHNELLKQTSSIELRKRLERFGVFLKEAELELIEQVFTTRPHSKQENDSQKIQVHFLLQHINPRISCADRLLLHKIRHTLRVFARSDKGDKTVMNSPSQPFERYDPAQSGFVSRAEFKRCLSVLGFELLDIDKAYQEFVEKETRSMPSDRAECLANNIINGENCNKNPSVDLDEQTVSKTTAEQATAAPPLSTAVRVPIKSVSNPPTGEKSVNLGQSRGVAATLDARSEFDRRKELFLERMKAIASSSAKSSVYEQLERQKGDRRAESGRVHARVDTVVREPTSEQVKEQLALLHVPKALHHDAARLLQRQFRYYRMRQSATAASSTPSLNASTGSIVAIDALLGRMLKTWTRDELEALEATIVETIERELPKARKERFISRKQLGFVLSKIPRIALEPQLLRDLSRHFTVASKSDSGDVAYRPLVRFVCSVTTDPKKGEYPPIPLIKALSKMYVDVNQLHQTLLHVGDVNGNGRTSVKRFHDALSRARLRFTPSDLRVLTVLLSDHKGVEVLYTPLLKMLRDSSVATQMRQVVSRCSRFGVSKLRETLLARISTDDGLITREQLHNVLMQENAEVCRFEPSDSYVLIEMVHSNCIPASQERISGDSTLAAKVSIDDLVLLLEHLVSSLTQPLSDNMLNSYTMPQLQRLAMSTRSLLCPPYAAMIEEFERFDWKETGLVSLAEFTTVVPRIGFALFTDQQVNQIAKNFGAKLKGAFGINYRQFLDWTTPNTAIPDMETMESKLRRVASDQSNEANPIASILMQWRDCFVCIDKLSSGFVTRAEFAAVCLENLKLPLTSEELRTLLFNYDRNMDDKVDYGAFVQLNWRETSRQNTKQQRKQVQFESQVSSLSDILARLHKSLSANNIAVEDVARVLSNSKSDEDGNTSVDITQFIVYMKQLGAILSPAEADVIFNAYGEADPKGGQKRVQFVQFMGSTLGLPPRRSDAKGAEDALSKEDEHRLRTAVASALKYSRKEFERARAQFDEFCVVYDYGEIPSRKLWKHFERNGLTSLLSKKGTGLLIQKFTKTNERDAKGSNGNDDETTCVQLRKVSKYLQDASQRLPLETRDFDVPKDANNNQLPLDTALAAIRQLAVMYNRNGKDIRAAFEDSDPRYSGTLPAIQFKSILLEMGLATIVRQSKTPIASETIVGVLVREYRSHETPGGVNYAILLAAATSFLSADPLNAWVYSFTENLRSRIRLKAGLKGAIPARQPIEQLCKSLDSAFAHFDQQRHGFLTLDDISTGLRALKYQLTSMQVAHFMKAAAVFRHTTGNGSLSRMEFDAFVLDPSSPLLLRRIAESLYRPSTSDPSVPCVAHLSQIFMGKDQPDHLGVLSACTACSAISDAIQEQLSAFDQRRLQILFDVNRDGMFAYKLFMKVISQWHGGVRVAPLDQGRSFEDQKTGPVNEMRRASFTTAAPSFKCSRDDVLRALYNQLSSIDFDSQMEIFTEHLTDQARSRGYISTSDFEIVLDRIRLKLSTEGLECLQASFGNAETNEVDYRAVVKAIRRIHTSQADS